MDPEEDLSDWPYPTISDCIAIEGLVSFALDRATNQRTLQEAIDVQEWLKKLGDWLNERSI